MLLLELPLRQFSQYGPQLNLPGVDAEEQEEGEVEAEVEVVFALTVLLLLPLFLLFVVMLMKTTVGVKPPLVRNNLYPQPVLMRLLLPSPKSFSPPPRKIVAAARLEQYVA